MNLFKLVFANVEFVFSIYGFSPTFTHPPPRLNVVALKNMGAHRPRNRKTTVLYAMSLAFIVFISTAYNSQIDAFVTQVEVCKTISCCFFDFC
jgi:hypothetical protein